jgi:hypothetical protein
MVEGQTTPGIAKQGEAPLAMVEGSGAVFSLTLI